MTTIKSSISTTSAAFKAKAEAMGKLVSELKDKMAVAALGGGERSRKRHTERGITSLCVGGEAPAVAVEMR